MAHEVFICCSSRDRTIAETLERHLKDQGISCYPLEDGSPFDFSRDDRLLSAIAESSVVVVLFSDNSSNLIQIKNQILHAVRSQVSIIPFKVRRRDRQEQGSLGLPRRDPSEHADASDLGESESLIKHVMSLLGRSSPSGIVDDSQEVEARAVKEQVAEDTSKQAPSEEAGGSGPRQSGRKATPVQEVRDLFKKYVTTDETNWSMFNFRTASMVSLIIISIFIIYCLFKLFGH